MLTIGVKQRGIKSHLERGQRVIGGLLFEVHFEIKHPEQENQQE